MAQATADPLDALAAQHGATVAAPDVEGRLAPGTIDLSNRPRVTNPDGSISTVRSISINVDGKEVLIPTVVGGRVVSDDEAVAAYRKTGQHLGMFDTPDHATAYAQQLHRDQAATLDAPGDPLDALAAQHGAVTPTFAASNEKDESGNAIVRGVASGVASTWKTLNTPLIPQIADAAHAIADHIDAPALDRSQTVAQIRGFLAGATEGAGNVAAGFTSPVGIALSLAGMKSGGIIAEQIPALKSLLALPAVQALQRTVQGVSGTAFAAHGAGQVVTAPTWAGKAQGLAEMAGGAAGALSAGPRSVQVTPRLANPNAVEAAAVRFGQDRGIPVDAGAATGNAAVKGAQFLADRSIGGSVIAGRAKAAQGAALERVGGELADVAHPVAQIPELAGQALSDALTRKVAGHVADQHAAYGRLEAIETARPAAVTVDLVAAKAALQPVYDQMKRQLPVTQQQASPGLKAIENILEGPDAGPLSQIDRDLSAIKAVAREHGGLAKLAVTRLDGAVRAAAAKGGPDAVAALTEGRQATVAKYATQDVLDRLKAEPVGTYKQMTAPQDGGIALLRTVQQHTPDVLPQIARAKLDELLTVATKDGGFQRTDKLDADWSKLGTQTKQILFPKPGHVQELDHFFRLAKKMNENINPSGTAHGVSLAAQAVSLVNPATMLPSIVAQGGAGALSAILHSPAGVRALTNGMRVSLRGSAASPAARVASWTAIAGAARAAGVPLALPAAASTEPAGR